MKTGKIGSTRKIIWRSRTVKTPPGISTPFRTKVIRLTPDHPAYRIVDHVYGIQPISQVDLDRQPPEVLRAIRRAEKARVKGALPSTVLQTVANDLAR